MRRLISLLKLASASALVVGASGLVALGAASAATPASTLDLNVLLIGTGSSDPTTAAWQAALSNEGVPYTLATATGTYGSETVTLPTLSSGSTGYFNGVVIADSPAGFTAGQLTALDTYEATFGVNQIDGYTYPYLGETEVSGGALDGTTATLTATGLAALPALAGPIPFATGTYGYPSSVNAGAPFTPWLENTAGNVLAGVYQHPSTDPQANVAELELNFDYNATQLQWLLLAPGLINWVTQDTHLGLYRNYVEMDIDDTFTPDNAWSTTVHDNDYSDADSLRMDPADVVTAADWSNPTQEKDSSARPTGEPTTPFRLDQLFNYGGTVEYQNGELDLPGEPTSCTTAGDAAGTCGPDPLLAEFQATDPATGKSYADDFGWLSHTYDTPYLDVGCATQDYIEAELNENTSDVTAAPGATPGTGGLGVAESSIAAGATDVSNPYGTYNPQVFVPGNHSGFADLEPGTPATVDPPDLDEADAATTGGTLASGTYEYAVTDQFNGADSTSTDQSQAYVTDGLQGDVAPVVVTGPTGSVSLIWQAICHAANYIIYRAPVSSTGTVGPWTEIGTYATPDSAILPDNSSGDTNPAQTATVCLGSTGESAEGPDPASCAGEQELTFTDTGSDTATPPAGVTYLDTSMPSGWTPPIVEDANELPWEQNPYFTPALQAVGITTVGADASKAYPDPADDQFGIGATYSGATYAAGQPFVDGTAQVAPRHPINIFYNVATNAQELDEYNTLYSSAAPGSQCHDTSVTTCSSSLYTFPEVIDQVVSGMLENVLSNNPEVSYVHQTNLMGTPPYSSILPPANYVPAATAQSGTDGDGTLYEVLNPLISEYDSYFNSNTPYVQLTLGGIGNVLADQTAWADVLSETTPTVTASETNGVVTIDNTGTALNVPVTVSTGTTVAGSSLQSYGGELSNWLSVAGSSSQTLTENVAPVIASAASATSIVGAPFSSTVTTTGAPLPALTETGVLPAGITFIDNGNGTATIAGTSTTGSGGSYPITITATSTAGTTSQSFTLTNDEAPAITSATTAAFGTGVAGTYSVTTTGYPAPSLGESGALPAGLTFTDNGNGTATIAGTPTATGSFPVTISASNASGSTSTLSLTITVNVPAAPAITSLATAYFTLNQTGSFAIVTTGSPTSAITETGTLPAGLTFTDNGNGTALLSGTPTATGTTDLTVTANNGVIPNATQALTVVVGQAPAITSAASASFTPGIAGSFAVTTTGYPAPSLGESGELPAGLAFTDNGNGTATITGTPTATGSFSLTITATNGTGSVTQSLVLGVGQTAQAITFTGPSSGSVGTSATLSATGGASGNPVVFSIDSTSGTGVCNVSGTNGTTLNYTAAGSCVIDANQAGNTSYAAATQVQWSITVVQLPAFTSAPTDTVQDPSAFTFSVTATGTPTPAIALASGSSLPAGVTLADNGNGTATLAGTSSVAAGVYNFTISATNSAGSTTQAFTLTVTSVPEFTSLTSTTFTVGQPASFTVTATGTPTPTLSESGTLPAGVTFTAGTGTGTATLAGTLSSAGEGTFPLILTATSTAGTTTQPFTLTVISGSQVITSAASTTFTAGTAGAFTVTATGTPTPTLSESGALPSGVTFKAGTAGTATLSGTPAATAKGIYPITLTATNTAGRTSQAFTLTVDQVPSFSSAAAVTETAGTAFSFTVSTTGYPTPTLSSGNLPAGVRFSDNGNGTGTLSGTTAVTAGTYTLTVTAVNPASTSQTITLTVKADGTKEAVPSFTSATTATATAGTAFSFTVTTAAATTYSTNVTHSGTLPGGVSFSNKGNGTATLSGTPTAASGGTYTITFTAKNTAGTTTQSFVLTVNAKPTITSAASATATVGSTFSFTVKTTGYPAAAFSETGALPAGLSFNNNGNGTAAFSGTPNAGSGGVYTITISATNSVGTATQTFALTVRQPPVITSASTATATHGTAFTFTFTSTGYPLPTITHTGTVRGLTFTNNGNGTATLSGTPTTAGTYTITITATNNSGTAKQTFTLTVK